MEAAPIQHSVHEVPEMAVLQNPKSYVNKFSNLEITLAPKGDGEGNQESLEIIEDIAEKMNNVASVFNTSLDFSVDEATGKTVIKVIDKETERIIRQIPPEEMLRLIIQMRDIMGLLLDVEI